MGLAAALARVVPFAAASGINLYATVVVLGLAGRLELLEIPEQFRPLEHPLVIGVAVVLYLIEFVVDKIPWLDSLWDAVHSVVRPVGGAVIAVTALGESSPAVDALAALIGGAVALTTHLTKAGTRAAVNASPEPFSNVVLSVLEDVFVVGLTYLAVRYPFVALVVVLVLLSAVAAGARLLFRAIPRRRRREREAA